VGEQDWRVWRFEEHRSRLQSVAYRMLGTWSDADDAVQESWIRFSRSDTSGVDNLGGWLTTVVARVCRDMLRSRASRREEPAGADLPDVVDSASSGVGEALGAHGRRRVSHVPAFGALLQAQFAVADVAPVRLVVDARQGCRSLPRS
jgi:DNA-directed RNA polymerase specialized sigma24 family protein